MSQTVVAMHQYVVEADDPLVPTDLLGEREGDPIKLQQCLSDDLQFSFDR